MGVRRLSPRTRQAYLAWIVRFIHHHDTRHPAAMGEAEVRDVLNWLVVDRKVAHSTQMQARRRARTSLQESGGFSAWLCTLGCT
jgi:hypothetical protein